MELIAGYGELLVLLNMACVVIALPLWLGLGVATFVSGSRSRAEWSGTGGGVERAPRQATRLGRPAMIVAFALVGMAGFLRAMIAIAAGQGEFSPILEPLLWVMVGSLALADALGLGLMALLVSILRDVTTERRRIDRGTVVAYATIAAASAVVVGYALVSGAFRRIL